jgi:hypothetical protein
MLRSGGSTNASGFPFKRPSGTTVGQKKLSSSLAKTGGYSSVIKMHTDNLSSNMVFSREYL